MWNLIFLVTGAIFIALLLIIFFSKEVIDSKENKFFKALIMVNLVEYCIEIPLQLFVRGLGIESIMVDIFSKLYLAAIFTWFSFFSIYTFIICLNKKDENKYEKQFSIIKNINLIVWVIGFILLTIMPFSKFHEGDKMYIYGGAVDILKLFLGLYMLIWIVLLFRNIKNIKEKKYAPIFLVLLLLGVNTVLQTVDPSILIASMIGTLICYIMSFTIENPDLKMLRQMELAKDQAERANRAKSDFLSSMSHEIRTPLNAIVGFSEDIQSHKETADPEIVEDADYIMEASKTLLEIVGNILDINKIESDKMEITEVKYNFKEEIENLAKIDATRIGEKNINFKINLAPDIPYELLGDKTHIKEIVNNLLTNAIKYTDQGEIELNAKCINKDNICNLIISVRDTGRGIKAENINKLFTKFERLDAEKNSTTEGTGLGLAITKALVEIMGGKINVQSQFGQGSMFVVQIPQKISQMVNPDQTVQINIAPIKQAMEQPKTETVMPQPSSEPVVAKPTPSVESNSVNYSGKKILIVDDNKLNIKVARRALEGFNFEIDECYDGQECLDKVINGNEYDLILMDIMMPNMSGETAIAKLKENPNFKIPTIALTSDAVAGAREKYIGEGFVDYIAKPFNKDQIKEKLDLVFGSTISSVQNIKEKDEVFDALSDMSKPIQEIELPNTIDTTPKFDPTIDRFKDVEAHVFGGDNDKKEGNE